MTKRRQWSRRQWLAAAGSTAALGLAGCSSDDGGSNGTADDGKPNGIGGDGSGPADDPTGDTATVTVTADGRWPTAGFNPQNQQYVPDWNGPAGSLRDRWSAEIGAPGSGPVVIERTVFVGTANNEYYAFDVLSGDRQWHRSFAGNGKATPTVTDDTVYVGGEHLFALAPDTGDTEWQFETEYPPTDIRTADGTVYVSTGQTVLAVDTESKSSRWTAETNATIGGIAIGPDGTVFVRTHDHGVRAFDSDSGAELWGRTWDQIVREVGLTVADGRVYISNSREAKALDAATGETDWAVEKPVYTSAPAVADGTVYLPGIERPLVALDASSGTELADWEMGADLTPGISSVVADETAYVWGGEEARLGNPGRLYAVDTASGDVETVFETEAGFKSQTAVLEDLVFYSGGGQLVALQPV